MKRHIVTACLYTLITGVLLGIVYPLVITAIAHVTMANKATGQLLTANGDVIGSALIGQPFTGPGYFHSRPSAAGTGYDASASSGSNYGPTNTALVQRVASSVKSESTGTPVPVDLVTASGSGLDPDITPAAAMYQVARVAGERHLPVAVGGEPCSEGNHPKAVRSIGRTARECASAESGIARPGQGATYSRAVTTIAAVVSKKKSGAGWK